MTYEECNEAVWRALEAHGRGEECGECPLAVEANDVDCPHYIMKVCADPGAYRLDRAGRVVPAGEARR